MTITIKTFKFHYLFFWQGRFLFKAVYILLLSFMPVLVQAASSESNDHAVILMYHHVANNTPVSTSISPDRFKQHIQYLIDNKFTVLSLSKALRYLKSNKPLPSKAVVITFDDAYKSVYTDAFPLLKKYKLPFTVFVTTGYIGEENFNFMSWDQLREITMTGGELGNHTDRHEHLVRKKNNETAKQWRSRIRDEIIRAQTILKAQTGNPIRAVAYPYGEYSTELKKIIRDLGYFGLGQHSGVAYRTGDFQAIPRYPLSTGFDDLEDFALKVSSLNLPVTVISPKNGLLSKEIEIPELKLQLLEADYDKNNFACYASGQGKIKLQWLNKDQGLVNVRANSVIPPGRTKYNCTAPSRNKNNVFYWFSFLWMKPLPDGSWYVE